MIIELLLAGGFGYLIRCHTKKARNEKRMVAWSQEMARRQQSYDPVTEANNLKAYLLSEKP